MTTNSLPRPPPLQDDEYDDEEGEAKTKWVRATRSKGRTHVLRSGPKPMLPSTAGRYLTPATACPLVPRAPHHAPCVPAATCTRHGFPKQSTPATRPRAAGRSSRQAGLHPASPPGPRPARQTRRSKAPAVPGSAKSYPNSTINVFTVASGHMYERLQKIMILSVLRHTKSRWVA